MPTEAVVGLFTLGGVALGFAGQWLMERQRTRRTRTGVVKAMLGELRHNAGVCVDIRYGGPLRNYSTDTWEAARFELAQFVPDRLFQELLFIYEDMIPRVQRLLEDRVAASQDAERRVITEFTECIKGAMKGFLCLPYSGSFRKTWRIGPEIEEVVFQAEETEGEGAE